MTSDLQFPEYLIFYDIFFLVINISMFSIKTHTMKKIIYIYVTQNKYKKNNQCISDYKS